VPRPEKDAALHELQGTTSVAKPAAAATAVAGKPKMPAGLSNLGRPKWREMVKLLSDRRVLTRADGPALELYVETWCRWKACLKEIADHGVLVAVEYSGPNGEPCSKKVPNPAAKLAGQLEVSLRNLLKELGGTPASRERAKPTKPDPKNKKTPPVPGTIGALRPDLFQDGQPQDDDPILL